MHHGSAARRKAEADLAQARQASTRDEMQQCLRDMNVASGQPAAPSVAVGPPEQAPAAPSVAVAPVASSVAVGPLQQVGTPGPPGKRLRGRSPGLGTTGQSWRGGRVALM